jgi:MoaD family protein
MGEQGMSVEVRVPTVLRKHTGGARVVRADGSDVRAVLDDLEHQFPGLKQEVMNEEGQVRQFVNIYVNDEDIRYLQSLQTKLEEGDSLAILPAVAGGSGAEVRR